MELKDKLAIWISLVALVSTAISAFFQFRDVDDLKVLPLSFVSTSKAVSAPLEQHASLKQSMEESIADTPETFMEVETTSELTFVNAGNRTAAVLSIRSIMVENAEVNRLGCEAAFDADKASTLDINAFTIAPGEIKTDKFSLQSPALAPQLNSDNSGMSEKVRSVGLCLMFIVVDSDGVIRCPVMAFGDSAGANGRARASRLLPSAACGDH